jgi:hypothetical protein
MTRKEKRAALIVCLIMGIPFLLSHFYIGDYNGKYILLVGWETIFRDPGSARVIGSYTINTSYGDVRIKNFARASILMQRVANLAFIRLVRGRISFNFDILGNKITKGILDISGGDLECIYYDDYLKFGGLDLFTKHINLMPEIEQVELVIANGHFAPVELTDSTVIGLDDINIVLAVNNTWEFRGEITVHKLEWAEPVKYSRVVVNAGWGDFLEGEEMKEKEKLFETFSDKIGKTALEEFVEIFENR